MLCAKPSTRALAPNGQPGMASSRVRTSLISPNSSFTVDVPEIAPRTTKYAAWGITLRLFNGDASTWYYFDEVSYGNSTGIPANPETCQLAFDPNQVTRNVESIAATTSTPTPNIRHAFMKLELRSWEVYTGDSVSIAFALTSGTTWKQIWSVAPGAIWTAAGAKPSSGSYSFTFCSFLFFQALFLNYERVSQIALTICNLWGLASFASTSLLPFLFSSQI